MPDASLEKQQCWNGRGKVMSHELVKNYSTKQNTRQKQKRLSCGWLLALEKFYLHDLRERWVLFYRRHQSWSLQLWAGGNVLVPDQHLVMILFHFALSPQKNWGDPPSGIAFRLHLNKSFSNRRLWNVPWESSLLSQGATQTDAKKSILCCTPWGQAMQGTVKQVGVVLGWQYDRVGGTQAGEIHKHCSDAGLALEWPQGFRK